MRRTRKRRNFFKSHEQSSGLMYLLTGRAAQAWAPEMTFGPFSALG